MILPPLLAEPSNFCPTPEEIRRSIEDHVEREAAKIISSVDEIDCGGLKVRLVASPIVPDNEVWIFGGRP